MRYHDPYNDGAPPLKKPPKNGFKTLGDIAKFTSDTMDQWIWSITKEELRDIVTNRLNQSLETMVLAFLGLKKSHWDEWEVRRRRGGDHLVPLRELIEAEAETMFRDWITEQMPKITSKPLLKKQVKAIREEYQEILWHRITELVRERAHSDAELLMDSLTELRPDDEVQDYILRIRGLNTLAETEL